MAKPKAAKNCKIPVWLSARQDGREGRFIMVGNSFLLAEPVKELTASAQTLYFAMCMEAGGKRKFTFPESAMIKYGFSVTTAKRSIKALVDARFITLVSSGKNTRTPNEYEFCFGWKNL